MAVINGETPFVKQLAANDRKTRDEAVDKLRSYLSHKNHFTEVELLKLWKGLFYCMWMSDKPRPQQRLARDLAGLVDCLKQDVFLGFLSAFWKTMAREWAGIDALRLNKFLFLIRQYLNSSFTYLSRNSWQQNDLIDGYLNILRNIPLSARGKVRDGLRFHVVDIYVDELDKVDKDREKKMPLKELLAPLVELGKESPTKTVRRRVKEALLDERLIDWNGDGQNVTGLKFASQEDEEEDDPEAAEWGGFGD